MKQKIVIMSITLVVRLVTTTAFAETFFPTFPDSNTVALWLFDETEWKFSFIYSRIPNEYDYMTLCDAGEGAYDLRLMPNGRLLNR
jgi:hypothetical protein